MRSRSRASALMISRSFLLNDCKKSTGDGNKEQSGKLKKRKERRRSTHAMPASNFSGSLFTDGRP